MKKEIPIARPRPLPRTLEEELIYSLFEPQPENDTAQMGSMRPSGDSGHKRALRAKHERMRRAGQQRRRR